MALDHSRTLQDTTGNPLASAPSRRRRTSSLLHRLALLLALAVGTGALVYNAVSIVNGEGGLVSLPGMSDTGGVGRVPTERS